MADDGKFRFYAVTAIGMAKTLVQPFKRSDRAWI